MAVSTDSYFSNASPGELQLFKGNIFVSETSPSYAVGTRVSLQDGRVFRYSHFGAAVNRGLVVSQDLSESAVVDTDNAVIAPASAVSVAGEVIQPGAINSRFVQLTLASVTANQFAGGYLHITDDTGEGFTYRIKGNTATGDPATGDIRLELNDRLQVALDATSDIAITGSLYANLEAATQATDEVIAGVSVATQAAADYGFIQTQGVATVLTDGTVVIADRVAVGTVAGSAAAVAATVSTTVSFGQVIHVGDDTGHSAINLNIAS